MAMTKTLSMISRTGRDLQRYNDGCRQVVGCIPYRYRKTSQSSTVQGTQIDDLEFLLISSQKSSRWMFPKGGWETDEALEDAALRETFEESGVIGDVEVQEFLGTWSFKSKSQGTFHEGHMFPLLVTEELDDWPEKTVRKRLWLKFSEAREVCFHSWMKEALDVFASKLTKRNKEEEPQTCPFDELSMFYEEPRINIEANDHLTCEKELRISLVAKPSLGKMSSKAQKMFNEEVGNSHVAPMFGEGRLSRRILDEVGAKNQLNVNKSKDNKVDVKKIRVAESTEKANKPKRPLCAYFIFMEEYKEKHPNNKSVAVVGKAAGEKWKSFSDEEKALYQAKAEEMKAEYLKNMRDYKNKQHAGVVEEEEDDDKSRSEVNDNDEEDEGDD
ncbi:hypothetical protein K7X08_034499 [Anisodus acutangulus]|uniref:Uncharacterized protein n=1 Tax=Anisodus acutangulus TaxID=402998 RepID=A0A9Q1LFM0_9SOLA|nr:hypothetical protein K7X08_034499 [Anisodus acutangulus]